MITRHIHHTFGQRATLTLFFALAVSYGMAQAPVLSGTIAGWDGGEARLAAESFTSQAADGAPIAETTIAADGSFTLPLPNTVPAVHLGEIDATMVCEAGGPTLDPERFMGAGVFALLVYEDEAPAGMLMLASTERIALEHEAGAEAGDYAVFFVYAEQPVTITGTCEGDDSITHYRLDLSAGWNTIVSTTIEATSGALPVFEERTGDVPDGAAWYLGPIPDDAATLDTEFTVTDTALDGPDLIAAGYATIALRNGGTHGAELTIVQLGEVPLESLVEKMQAVDQAYMDEGGDPVAAMRDFLASVTLWGGTSAEPGEEGAVGVSLPTGSYAIVATLYPAEEEGAEDEGPSGPPTYLTKEFDVVEYGMAAAPPATEAVVSMVDFAFAFPADVAAGEQTWEFVNRGAQVHVAAIMKLLPGKTMDDVMAYAASFEGEDPTEEFAYVGMVSPGVSNFLTFDVTPGTYVAVCWFPDYAEGGDGAPHYEHGMLQSFTVLGN